METRPPVADRSPAARTAYPDHLRRAERDLLQLAPHRQGREPAIGVGLSGGGIRAATFSLGVFQAWAPRRFVRRIDFLSTVSGGGYFGAFLGRLFSRAYIHDIWQVEAVLGAPDPDRPAPAPNAGLHDQFEHARHAVVNWLRENGRYLSPRGGGDLLIMAAALFRNWLAINFVLGHLALVIFLLMQSQHFWLPDSLRYAPPGGSARMWWSPWILAPLVPLALVPSLVWGYWLMYRDRQRWFSVGASVAAAAILAAAVARSTVDSDIDATIWAAWLLVTAGALAAALIISRVNPAAARNRMSGALKYALLAAAGLLMLGLIDSLGLTVYAAMSEGHLRGWLAGVAGAVAAAAAFARQIAVLLGPKTTAGRLGIPKAVLAIVAAALLVLALAIFHNVVAQSILWGFQRPSWSATSGRPDWSMWLAWCAAIALITWGFGRSWSFVNQSTHQPIYQARLSRAYLGASNPARWMGTGVPVIDPLPDDDMPMAEYWSPLPDRYTKGAPLHIVNTTINETIDGRSQVEQLDRKGLGLAVGPAGLSVHLYHHLVFGDGVAMADEGPRRTFLDVDPACGHEFRVFEYGQPAGPGAVADGARQRPFPGEALSLGQWIAVSGAAFSTGLGARTSLGLSVVAGLLNVRLGHWWDSRIDVARRDRVSHKGRWPLYRFGRIVEWLLPVQKYLSSEIIARFPGVARRYWYLSDGGHYENLGGYELIRRRLDLIVLVDAEQDESRVFPGLANLVRKARIDFGAEIEFLDAAGLEAIGFPSRVFGSLDDLRHAGSGGPGDPAPLVRSPRHAALAVVRYDDETEAEIPRHVLLYLKPTLTGDEPADIIEYARRHSPFPHQSTGDQFFDEAQWESYRALGEHVAAAAFDDIRAYGPDWLKRRCGM